MNNFGNGYIHNIENKYLFFLLLNFIAEFIINHQNII
jgi:hypothetical protein